MGPPTDAPVGGPPAARQMMRTHTGIDTPMEGSVIVHKARTAVTAIVFATATAVTTPLVLAPASAAPGAGPPAAQQITVNLASQTGPVFHGATGALYGLSENGVPGADLLSPLHVRAIAAKPPAGLQHPTGDADKIAPEFFGAGGQQILVYMQDIYSDWPYQNLGLSDYLPKAESIVTTLAASRYRNTRDLRRYGCDLGVPEVRGGVAGGFDRSEERRVGKER